MDALKLHQESVVIDGHCDTLIPVRDGMKDLMKGFDTERLEKASRNYTDHIDIPRMLKGGLTTQLFACFIRYPFLPSNASVETLRMIDSFYQAVDQYGDQFAMVTTAAEIEQVKKDGKTSGMITIEGAEALEGNLAVVRMFYKLGVRQIGLTWNWRNQAADGLGEKRTGGGLTEFGVSLVKEMNRLGMIVDVAHLAPAGIRDVYEICDGPFVDSHCGAFGLVPHERNLSDEQLEMVAKKDGLVCVTYVPEFIQNEPLKASLADVVDHIDYIVKQIGIDCVGLGSDFDGYTKHVEHLDDVGSLPNITAELVKRGYQEADVKKILGGNYLRVMRQVIG